MDFSGFDKVFANAVYSIHEYCGFGFPNRIGRYQGKKGQDVYIRKMYDRKVKFMKKHNVLIWNGMNIFWILRLTLDIRDDIQSLTICFHKGEFGLIYEKEETNSDWKVHNEEQIGS
jgi:endoglucanase